MFYWDEEVPAYICFDICRRFLLWKKRNVMVLPFYSVDGNFCVIFLLLIVFLKSVWYAEKQAGIKYTGSGSS